MRGCRDNRRCSKIEISLVKGEVKPITVIRRVATSPILPTLVMRTNFDLSFIALKLSRRKMELIENLPFILHKHISTN